MLSNIVDALASGDPEKTDSPPQFSFECELNLSDVKVDIDGIGKLHFPMQEVEIKKVIENASLAKFGYREKTLKDTEIRNTYEISAEKINIKFPEDIFNEMLGKMRCVLGFPENVSLTGALHNLLIYEPGQFFKPHQDSEKLGGMVATLVIVLPSPHIGGDLLIYHNGQEHRFVSENLNTETFQCVAFYADCKHEVKPVRQGYRVALTYNIVLNVKNLQQLKSRNENKLLESALREYFTIYDSTNYEDPFVFAYFLDYEYSEHGLMWESLKGVDFKYAYQFLNAAKKLKLKPHLALVKLHESWSTEGDSHEPELCELIDNSVTLDYWIDEENTSFPYRNYCLSEDEFFWTKDTKEFIPCETHQEGWMGNYGNTMDFWYRRAAIVLWREEDQAQIEFMLNYDQALKKLTQLTREPGKEKTVLSIIEKAGKHIHRSYHRVDEEHLCLFMELAAYIKDPDVSKKMLSCFKLTLLNVKNVGKLLALQKTYGVNWCLALFKAWNETKERHYFGVKLFPSLYCLIRYAVSVHLDNILLNFIIDYQYQTLLDEDKSVAKQFRKQRIANSKNRINNALGLLQSCFLLSEPHSVATSWINHLISNKKLYDIPDIADIYFSLCNDVTSLHKKTLNLLRDYLYESIAEELKQGLRAQGDWSITVNLDCQCEYCKITSAFLHSKSEFKKVWPIAQYYRTHISDVVDSLGIPVELDTLKNGRPYKLVITKTNQLFHQSKERFDKLIYYEREISAQQ